MISSLGGYSDFSIAAFVSKNFTALTKEELQAVKGGANPTEIRKLAVERDRNSQNIQITVYLIKRENGEYYWETRDLSNKADYDKFELAEINCFDISEYDEGDLFIRGDKVYKKELNALREYLIGAGLLCYLPVHALFKKCFIPVVVYCPTKGLSKQFGRCEWLQRQVMKLEEKCGCKWAWGEARTVTLFDRAIWIPTPVRAIVAIPIHLVIGTLAMIPTYTNYFMKLNGWVEQVVNGHTDNDLETKSIPCRCREIPYAAPCQQAFFKIRDIKQIPTKSDYPNTHVNDLPREIQKIALHLCCCTGIGFRKPIQAQPATLEQEKFLAQLPPQPQL